MKIAGQRSPIDVARDLHDNIYVVNVNGDVFTRPFAYEPSFRLGNINRESMIAMVEGETYKSCQRAIRQRKIINCLSCEMRGFCDSSPMHEHGSVTSEGGRCVTPRSAMLGIESDLLAAGVDKSVIGDWAREWLAHPNLSRTVS